MDLKSKEVLQEALHLRISLVSVLTVLRIAFCHLKSYISFLAVGNSVSYFRFCCVWVEHLVQVLLRNYVNQFKEKSTQTRSSGLVTVTGKTATATATAVYCDTVELLCSRGTPDD